MSSEPAPDGLEYRRIEEPSTLFLLWPEPEAPLEEEVRIGLESGLPGITWIDELENNDDVLWGTVGRVPGIESDVLIWAEERGALSDTLIGDGLTDPDERRLALETKWLVGVETYLDPGQPQGSFQLQLQLMLHAAVPGLVAVYDDNALVVRSGQVIADQALAGVPPRTSSLYAIHTVGGRGGSWLHTHGLARIGLPEIDLVSLPPDYAREGYDLIDAAVDALMWGLLPDEEDRVLEIGEGLVVRALPLDEAMPALPRDIAGGQVDREGEMADHGGRHLVLFDPEKDAPPLDLLARFADEGVVYKSRYETERQSALSRERWGTFGQLFALHRHQDWRFHVKLAYERTSSPSAREHLWFEVLDLRPGQVHGRLLNTPHDVPDMDEGAESWHALDRLTDWLIVTPEGAYDPEVAPGLLREDSEDPV